MNMKCFALTGLTCKYGLQDGDAMPRENYLSLGVLMGQEVLRRNPSASFTIHQAQTSHNPIRLATDDELDLGGAVMVDTEALPTMEWSEPWQRTSAGPDWDYPYEEVWDYEVRPDFEGRIFEVEKGEVTYERS